jgi:hemoglobin-like flavoprotein
MMRAEGLEGAMTPNQIEFVQQSLPTVLALRDRAPARFEEQFFGLDPVPRRLFARGDIYHQASLLITAVAKAVDSLPTDDDGRAAGALSQYHLSFGVEPQHFRSAGAALGQTLEQELGSHFTEELGDAWASVCEWVGQKVLEASHPFAA